MRRSARSPAFTLIESMTAIAVLSILLAIAVDRWTTLGSLAREADYRFASATTLQARTLIDELPFDQLPPRRLVVGPNGKTPLGDFHIDAASLQVRWPDGVAAQGKFTLRDNALLVPARWEGKEIVVDYRFAPSYLPEQGDAYTVPQNAPWEVQLYNSPLSSVKTVWLASGASLTPLDPERYQATTSGLLSLDKELAGKVIVVDYVGESVQTWIYGSYLDRVLEPQVTPSDFKRLRVITTYGGARPVQLGVLRVKG